ncbi:Major facilitator superfamily domain, general substrate transporter [Metarhizium album ARSEF 1941]|uniref:Major facilitator superfamily domain, general substrate transporter n=1 Tax=Metarhizium album (strain ARSEF 1941) TaxID=1081103 RepID=A0A0B2X6S8_METAS|nr:Major facilitator superfamily domain, general substrate transporter [Metarhizium album ARSEF 1941]KHO02099.1 Major facilitator superfamily domain, general substrate transporter [Metarhizium album ARSEF 1941]
MSAPSTEQRASSSGSLSSVTVAQHGGRGQGVNDPYPGGKSDGEKALPTHEAPVAADGGTTAWLVVLGAWSGAGDDADVGPGIGAFQEYYQDTLLSSYSASTIAWIPSLQIFFMSAMGLVAGVLYDRHGPRQLLLVGSFLHVFGLMMCSLGTQYYQILLAQGVCSAIGVAIIFQPSINVIHGWFDKKRGAAFGILATGSSLGGVVFPIMVSRLIRQAGYAWAMRTCAFLILALLIVANLTIRAAHPPRPQKLTMERLAKPFFEFDFVFLCAGFFCFSFGIFVPIDYLPVQALDAGVDPNLAQYLLSILNAGSLLGRLSSGITSDKIGRYNIFVTVCALTGIWALALWIPSTSTGGIIAFAALFGFCSGAYVSLISPLVAQISPLREIGFRTGIIFFVSSIAGLTTNPISGAILGGDKNWIGVKVFAGVLCLAGTILVLTARIHRTGWKLAVVF